VIAGVAEHLPALTALIVLPLNAPILIFGAGAVSSQMAGIDPGALLSLLGALLALGLALAPWALACMRVSAWSVTSHWPLSDGSRNRPRCSPSSKVKGDHRRNAPFWRGAQV